MLACTCISTVLFYGDAMNENSAPQFWKKTRTSNLVRHANGRYYARLYRNGKEIWKSLRTDHASIAEARLAELQKQHRHSRDKDVDRGNAKMTFADAAAIYTQRVQTSVAIKRGTKKYQAEICAAVLKSWPELAEKEVRRIQPDACLDWATGFAKDFSATRYNAAIAFLRHVFDVAIESDVIFANPAAKLERMTVRGKILVLPTLAKFGEFIAEMRRGRGRDSKNCADLTEGLAYTGIRIGESKEVARDDVNFTTEELRVVGDPDERTKNSEIRWVPLIPEAIALFKRMLGERPDEDGKSKLFKVRECQKSIDRAGNIVGLERITHHDLRHLFATICIESGVDIPTVSRWLGHKDGGALAMRTYGHLRREHSAAQAKKVSFAPMSVSAS